MRTLTILRSAAMACALLGMAHRTAAQDTLFLRTGKAIAVHVDEIGLDDIKYRVPGDDLRVSVERSDVLRIKMADGREIRMAREARTAELPAHVFRRDQAIKFAFLSPAFNHLTFGYERMLRPWTNLDLSAGIIGVGFNQGMPDASGFLFRSGIKFISRPDVVARGMRLTHPLHGRYVKPELIVNSFSRATEAAEVWTGTGYRAITSEERVRYTNVAINLVVGKQRFLGDGATLDTWVGVGYGMQMHDGEGDSEYYEENNYSHLLLGKKTPLILSAGISLGVAFGRGQRAGQGE